MDKKVIAFMRVKDGVINSFGEGKLLGEMVPNVEPFNTMDISNPCILLDNGHYVWGFQCWWGDAVQMKEKYPESKFTYRETAVSEISGGEILPVKK